MEKHDNKRVKPDAIVEFSSQVDAKAKEIIARQKKENPNYKGPIVIKYRKFDYVQDDGYQSDPMV